MKKKADEKKCIICRRTLVAKSKTGLCPDCLNKYGSPAAVVGAGGIMYGAKILVKNRAKIAKAVVKVIGGVVKK